MGQRINFLRPDGKEEMGYLATAQAHAPGIIVIQEWWGVQGQITGICDRLAAAGYNALAPDLYNGVVVPYHDSAKANAEMSSLNFLEATDQAVRGAALYLRQGSSQGSFQGSSNVGITGFCMGGAVTILAAARVSEIKAGVCFYGLPPAEAVKPAEVRIPIQGHFAAHDDWCSPAVVDSFETGLKEAHKDYTFYRYDADHAFMNEQRAEVYQSNESELAWTRMMDFWKKHL